MPPARSEFRASYAKLVVRTVKHIDEPERSQALAQIGDPLRERIRAAGLFAWLEVEHFCELARAIHVALGEAGARSVWRQNLRESLERPLLAPLRIGALALYGKTPRSLLRMTPQAWGLVARGCGTPALVDLGTTRLRLTFSDLPDAMRDCPELAELWVGGALACGDYVATPTQVVAHLDELASGIGAIEVSWSE